MCTAQHQKILSRQAVSVKLDVSLLTQIGLVENEGNFNKRMIRLNTATLYRQQKFNLLREENEGYSGLVNELIRGMGPSIRAVRDENGQDRVVEQESAEERNLRAKRVMNNISALIGYFDLDPNRVLDIFLDVFSSNVVKHWPFFLALLSISPWGKRRSKEAKRDSVGIDDMNTDASSGSQFGLATMDLEEDEGRDVIAQLLGFKFGFYQQQDVIERVPEELYLLTALLIRERHVRFTDIYNHLSPNEDGMAKLHEKYKQSMSDKVMSAKGNALSMAAPLTEEGNGLDGSDAKGKGEGANGLGTDAQKEPPNQILGLLQALLSLGCLKGALLILGKYSWLCGAYPRIADLYCRLLNIIIEPAYSTASIATQIPAAATPSLSIARPRFDSKKQELVKIASPTPRITAEAPEPLPTMVSRFVYFYGPWKAALPTCKSIEAFVKSMIPLLRILGPYGYRNPTLFQRMCRIVKQGIQGSSHDEFSHAAWIEVVRNLLLPSLTMTSGNSGLVSEVWMILRQLTYNERYSIYGEWKYTLYRRPELRARQAETEKEAKGILKRISSDNLKLSGRTLAKSSHTNPTIFFTVALNQIQSYSNLIAPIVESAKYLTHFEYDVFGFNLIDALSNPEKERTKSDGTSVSMWLQSLAAFTGTLYKRYPLMDCSPILQYIANQLKENNSKDLIIIRELILKMAGIEPLANLSDTQVAALTGGRLLRMEAMISANASVGSSTRNQLRKSGARLLHALMDSRMAIPLLILIAQQRQACIHLVDASEAHLKYLGNLFDTCQEVLFQYVEFLHNELEPQAYSDLMPTLKDLCTRFELEPAIAFHIVRPRLKLMLTTLAAKENEERLRREVLASKLKKDTIEASEEEDVKMEDTDEGKDGEVGEKTVKAEEDAEDTEMADKEGAELTPGVKAEVQEEAMKSIWKEGIKEAIDAADAILKDETKDIIGINFYATFWQMGLADITIPTERYDQEMKSLQKIVDANVEGGRKSIPKARIQAQEMMAQLRVELAEQTSSHHLTMKRIESEKDHWFTSSLRPEIVYQIMQHCIIPRALLSPTDAIFAGKFLRLMHSIGTRNYSSLTAYDKFMMEQVAPLIFSCTENEIRNYSRFLEIVLIDMTQWYKDEKKYIAEAYGDNLPGFQMKWQDRQGGESIPQVDLLGHDKFKTVFSKWHSMLRTIFRECLCSKEYMRIRNTIVVMTRIAQQFPLWEVHGNDLLEAINTMTQEEERGDLKILGQGLMATLKKQQRTWFGIKKKIIVEAPVKDMASTSTLKPTESKTEGTSSQAVKESLSSQVKDLAKEEGKVDNREAESIEAKPRNASIDTADVAKEKPKSDEAKPLSKPDADQNPSLLASHPAQSIASEAKDKGASPDIQAARRAALESMQASNGAIGMNPPKSVASTASAQASRDRQSSTQQRDREAPRPASISASLPTAPASASSRFRDREIESTNAVYSPRSSTRSREVSPGASSSSVRGNEAVDTRQGSRNGSRVGSRAGSEEVAAAPVNRSSHTERDDKNHDRTSSLRRERDSRDSRDRSSNRERERDWDRSKDADRSRRDDLRIDDSHRDYRSSREARDSRGHNSRSDRDDKSRTSTRRDEVVSQSGSDNRALPTGPRASATENGRSSSEARSSRRDAREPLSASVPIQSQDVPTQPARGGRELMPSGTVGSTRQSEKETGNQSPSSAARKRSLADRLSATEGEGRTNGSTVHNASSTHRAAEEEPNKRARISQGREVDNDRSSSRRGDDRSTTSDAQSTSAAPASSFSSSTNGRNPPSHGQGQVISIHGQGRPGSLPSYQRRDSGQTGNQSRSTTPYNASNRSRGNEDQQQQPQPYQNRRQADNNGHGHGHSRGSGGERDQRRRERRSGQQ